MMKTRLAFALFVALGLAGCSYIETVREYSNTLTEPAEVVDLIYTPANHGSGLSPTMSMNGKLGVAMVDVDVPQKYAVVFQCQHGKFIIEGNQEKAKELWERLKEHQQVTVSYREVYDVTYTSTDGVKKLTAKKLVDYDFLDAR